MSEGEEKPAASESPSSGSAKPSSLGADTEGAAPPVKSTSAEANEGRPAGSKPASAPSPASASTSGSAASSSSSGPAVSSSGSAASSSTSSGSAASSHAGYRPGVARRRPLLRRTRRAQRWAFAVVIATLAAGILFAHRTYRDVVSYPDRPGAGSPDTIIEFEVPRGASFPDVLRQLVDNEVLPQEEAKWFKLFVLHRGAAGKITAGEHRVRGDMTPEELLAELIRRQPSRELRVTIPEGKHTLEIAGILASAGLSDEASLAAAMRDPALLEELGIEADSVEGYLFPDTYKFKTRATAEEIIRRLVKRHRQVFADVRRRHRDAAARLKKEFGWGDYEIVTFASLVEKETGVRHERPMIAQVFLNRLRFASFKPKRLETDPTIIYGCTVPEKKSEACASFEGRIRRIHLRDPDNPYNTYTHEGLPPGPITNPGKAALESVLAPKKSRFLFFVARGDGSHKFSKSRAEHEAAVDEFIRGKKPAG